MWHSGGLGGAGRLLLVLGMMIWGGFVCPRVHAELPGQVPGHPVLLGGGTPFTRKDELGGCASSS